MKIEDEDDNSSAIWFTDTAQNAIWHFKKSTEQFEMYKIPAQSESFGTTYPITINIFTNKSDKSDNENDHYHNNNNKSIFFIGTFFPSLWFAEIDKLKNDTADGIHEIRLPKEYGFSNIDPLYVTSGSFTIDEDRKYLSDDDEDNNDSDDNNQDNKIDLWITNPGINIFYNYKINEQEITKNDQDMNMGSAEEENNKKKSYDVSIKKYTTSMASSRIFGKSFYDNNDSNKTEDIDDLRNKYYTLPSWIKKVRDGSIWFNQQQGNRIARFDPSEQLLVEYWIPSQNKEWGSQGKKVEKSINKSGDMITSRGCGIANVLNFALKENDEKKKEDKQQKNTVEEVFLHFLT
jgi:virginiamycin B lyase